LIINKPLISVYDKVHRQSRFSILCVKDIHLPEQLTEQDCQEWGSGTDAAIGFWRLSYCCKLKKSMCCVKILCTPDCPLSQVALAVALAVAPAVTAAVAPAVALAVAPAVALAVAPAVATAVALTVAAAVALAVALAVAAAVALAIAVAAAVAPYRCS